MKMHQKRQTVGQFIRDVMAIDTEEEMGAFFDHYVAELVGQGQTVERAKVIARANIGWCFGEGMPADIIDKWVEVTDSAHPIFGIVMPTPEQALALGYKWGKEIRHREKEFKGGAGDAEAARHGDGHRHD